MLSRRTFFGGTVFVAAHIAARPAWAQDLPEDIVMNEGRPYVYKSTIPTVEDYKEYLQNLEVALTGAGKPRLDEIKLGERFLTDIPVGASVYDTADRFRQWRLKQVGSTPKERDQRAYYAHEWPTRGNPVIMRFFDATSFRKPAGDTTYWCAAFVSWVIARSRLGKLDNEKIWPYSEGAASAAYRSWGKDVQKDLGDKPRRGDLVVFSLIGVPYRGHVGFFHDASGDTIWVLGGNQGAANNDNGGEVNIARFARKSDDLEFHSFRRHPLVT